MRKKNVDLSSEVLRNQYNVAAMVCGKKIRRCTTAYKSFSCDRLFVSFTGARRTMKFLRQIKRLMRGNKKGNEGWRASATLLSA